MSELEDKIAKILKKFKAINAKYIAKKLHTNKKHINAILYSGKNHKYLVDSDYRWSLKEEDVKKTKRQKNKTLTYEWDIIKSENKSDIDKNTVNIKSLFNKYALVIPRPLIIELIKTEGVKIDSNNLMSTKITHRKYLDIISVIESNKSKGINNYLKKIRESQTQSHQNQIEKSDAPKKYIKRTLESPKMINSNTKTIGEVFDQFEISLDVFKKEIVELSDNLISNKVNIINKGGGIILTKKINKIEYREIKNHLIKKGYKKRIKKLNKNKTHIPKSNELKYNLRKVAREFNIDIKDVLDYLATEGIKIIGHRNTEISSDLYKLIKNHFSLNKLIINKLYTKNDLYKIFNVATFLQGGKWRNGYCDHRGVHFIFANLGLPGKGFGDIEFNYNNVIDENGNLRWEAKNKSKIHHDSIQRLIKSNPLIFIRTKEVEEPYWKYIGSGTATNIIRDSSPVRMTWDINNTHKFIYKEFVINEEGQKQTYKTKAITNKPLSYNTEKKLNIFIKERYYDCLSQILVEALKFNNLLSVRAFHVLGSARIITAKDLIEYFKTNDSFTKIRNCGENTNIELIKLSKLLINYEEGFSNQRNYNTSKNVTEDNRQIIEILGLVLKNIINSNSNNNLKKLIPLTYFEIIIFNENNSTDQLDLNCKINFDYQKLKSTKGIGISKLNLINLFFHESTDILNVFLDNWNHLESNKKEVIKTYLKSNEKSDINIFSTINSTIKFFNSIENNQLAIEYFLKNIYTNSKKDIILDYVFGDYTLAEIGGKYKLSKERIRQITTAFYQNYIPILSDHLKQLKQLGLKEIEVNPDQLFISIDDFKKYNINNKILIKIISFKVVSSYNLFNKLDNIFQEFYLNKEHEKYDQIKDILDSIDSEIRNNKMINLKSLLASDYMLYEAYIESNFAKIFNTEYIYGNRSIIYSRTLTIPDGIKFCIDKYFSDKDFKINDIYQKTNEIFHNDFYKLNSIKSALIRLSSVTTYGKTGVYTLKKNFPYDGKNTTRDIIIEFLKNKKHPVNIEIVEAHVLSLNPYLKNRATSGVIDLNEKYFKKYRGTGYIGLKSRKYNLTPVELPRKKINDILKSSNLDINWISIIYLIKKVKLNIPEYQIHDYLIDNYFIHKNKISKSFGYPFKDNLFIELLQNEQLKESINDHYYKKDISDKIKFVSHINQVIKDMYNIKFTTNEIQKLINFHRV